MKSNFSFQYNGRPFSRDTVIGESTTFGTVYKPEENICVCMEEREYTVYDAVEWVLHFENKGERNSGLFSDICDCDCVLPLELSMRKRLGYMPKEGNACVITMNGTIDGNLYWESDEKSALEFNFNHEYLDAMAKPSRCFSNKGGRSSDGMMPFFDVTSLGGGYIVAVGWTGDWKASFELADGGVKVKTGLKETNFYIKPGEKLRTSSVLVMKYEKGEDKYNKFRRLIKQHFSHKACTNAVREGLMAFELWGGISSEEMKKRINELKAHDIRFEEFWIDAGWYGECENCEDTFSGDWSKNTGNWEVNMQAHPDGLTEVAECAKQAGAGIMLWCEPERAIRGTKMTQLHPEWFLSRPNDQSMILNLGNKEAFDYVCATLTSYIEKLHMSCFRQDSNAELTDYFYYNDEADRRGITEIKHIMGQYRLWEYLDKKFPGLMIDNCASGGRRIDIETLKRTVTFFRSDYQCNFNENPEVLQVHNTNTSRYFPYMGCTSKTKSDTYAIRSSYSSSWGGAFYNTVFQSMDEADFAWAKQITEEYCRIRKYFSMDFYNHGSVSYDDTAWAIWQYHDAETQSGIVMAFRRSNSPFDQVTVKLNGLCKDKTYVYTDLDNGEEAELVDALTIRLPQKRSSVIFEYKEK